MTVLAAGTCVDGGIVAGSSLPAPALVIITGIIGIAFSLFLLAKVAAVQLDVTSTAGLRTSEFGLRTPAPAGVVMRLTFIL